MHRHYPETGSSNVALLEILEPKLAWVASRSENNVGELGLLF